ncbi:MAG: tryptophan synthase subunit alpha [Chloroflexota bacterium]
MSERLSAAFARLKNTGSIGVFPYLTAGFPDPATCEALLDTIARSGADGIELGIPFSDPLADGVTMQRASARALEHGVSLRSAIQMVARFREKHQTPIVLMTYVNPVLALGVPRFVELAADAGVDGLIVPDAPMEEAEALQAACAKRSVDYVYMVAPTSGDDRLAAVAPRAAGFVYCVALVGVTGARTSMSDELPTFLQKVRAHIKAPLVVGFGISRPEHVTALKGKADGAIVASALADLIERTPPTDVVATVGTFVTEFHAAAR